MKKLSLYIFLVLMVCNVGYAKTNNLTCYFKYSSKVVDFKFDFNNLTVEREKTNYYGFGFKLPIIYSKNADINGNHVYSYLVQENQDGSHTVAVLVTNLDNNLIFSGLTTDRIHKLEFDFLNKKKRDKITFPKTNNFKEEFKIYEIVKEFIDNDNNSTTEKYKCDGL